MSQINVDIVAPESGTDVTVDGNLIVTGTNNIRPYKVYAGLISQTGTDAPTVVIMENTIGNIVWSRNIAGYYQGYLAGEFLADKTFLIIGLSPFLYNTSFTFNRGNDDAVNIQNQTNDIMTDGILDNTPIEIRVYN